MRTGPDSIAEKHEHDRGATEIPWKGSKEFDAMLDAKCVELGEAELDRRLAWLNTFRSTVPGTQVEVTSSKKASTWSTAQVPVLELQPDGTFKPVPGKRRMLVVAPRRHLALGKNFLMGELRHEFGHAVNTDFDIGKRLQQRATAEGFPASAMQQLWNCVEDARMERMVAAGGNEFVRDRYLLAKNEQFIFPAISENITTSSAAGQLAFLIKLEFLWRQHAHSLPGRERPWSTGTLHTEAVTAFEGLLPELEKFMGQARGLPMGASAGIEKFIHEKVWPPYRDLYRDGPQGEGGESEGEGEGEGGEGDGPEGEGHTLKVTFDPEGNPTGPCPPELEKLVKQYLQKEREKLKKDAENAAAAAARREDAKKAIDNVLRQFHAEEHDIDASYATEYHEIVARYADEILQLREVFRQYCPKVADPEKVPARRGKKLRMRGVIDVMARGEGRPFERRNEPTAHALVLQVIVDVSGSMSTNERIQRAVEFAIVILEAARDENVLTEITLADDKYVPGEDETQGQNDATYVVKPFGAEFDGAVRGKLVHAAREFENDYDAEANGKKRFGNGNQDDVAVDEALRRMTEAIARAEEEYDRVAAMGVFITDATTENEKLITSVEEYRGVAPLVGAAIDPEQSIRDTVATHYGADHSIVPPTISEAIPWLSAYVESTMSTQLG